MIRGFILIAVSILLLKFAGANPIGSISIRSADSSSSPSDCDTTHPYCCNPPLNSPSLIKLFDELNTVITLLEPACTDRSFMENVSVQLSYFSNCISCFFFVQPPLRRIKFALDKKNEDKQNDFLNGAFELHMAIEERKKALCIIEEKKFYQGNNSTMEAMGECNLSCATTNVEKQIVLYVSVRMATAKPCAFM